LHTSGATHFPFSQSVQFGLHKYDIFVLV